MVGMKRIEIDPSVHLANMYCALSMCQTHVRKTDTAPFTPGAYSLETDGKHLVQEESAGIAD